MTDRMRPVFWVVLKAASSDEANKLYCLRQLVLAPLGLRLFAAKDAGFYGIVKVRGAVKDDAQVGTAVTTLHCIPTRCIRTGLGSYNIQFLLYQTPAPNEKVHTINSSLVS
jgi:hypothetical protein